MPLFSWTDSYAVKVRAFDEQHQKLFELVNQLHDAMLQGRGGQIIKPVLHELLRYTAEHFAAEERAMERTRYPNLAIHRKEHMEFASKMKKLAEDVNSGRTAVSAPLLNFLRDWLTKHIRGTDQQYSAFLNAAGVA